MRYTMIEAQPTQFTLQDDGHIAYQAQASNPLPGDVYARIVKGDDILSPQVELLDGLTLGDGDKGAVLKLTQDWLAKHIVGVLEDYVGLQSVDGLPAPVAGICQALFDGFGVMPREGLETHITQLDTDTRQVLRTKKVRLGPVLAFLPAMNKPAAVRLRGLLWALFHGLDLPAPVPADGVVSFKMDDAKGDAAFYQLVGYPVYGPRAVRVDMLDRVINAVYEGAQGGKFKAQHKMAEWLGSSIGDLYAVLEALGHKKVHDPADESEGKIEAVKATVDAPTIVAENIEPAVVVEAVPAAPVEVVVSVEAEAVPTDDATAPTEKPAEQAKPELATFRLKKGKASGGSNRAPRADNAGDDKRSSKKDFKKKGKGKSRPPKEPRVMSAGPKKSNPEDSPFAILGQLKK